MWYDSQMWWRLLHYANEGLDDVGRVLTAWAIWKGIRSYWSTARDVVLVVLWLIAFGRNPVKGLGLENISFNDAARKALTWGTLLALIILAAAVLSHVQEQKAISA